MLLHRLLGKKRWGSLPSSNKQWRRIIALVPVIPIVILVLSAGCESPSAARISDPEPVLARVGSKTISVGEFIRRAEYTPRPPYCRGDTYIHKKIILNSLIAEKLFALEAGDDNPLLQSKPVAAALAGRREQAMRQWLYHVEGASKVETDTLALARLVRNMGRTYEIHYLSLPDSTMAWQLWARLLVTGTDLQSIYQDSLQEIPQRMVGWNENEHPRLLEILFEGEVAPDTLLAPVSTAPDLHILIQIDSWTDQPAITQQEIQNRTHRAVDHILTREGHRHYHRFTRSIMAGKSINFNPECFFSVVDLIAPLYLTSAEEQESEVQVRQWGQAEVPRETVVNQDEFARMLPQVLFTIDGEEWTFGDFLVQLRRHPLVFRRLKFPHQEFGEQYKLAIVDMITDHFLTREAYRRGYDRQPVVERYAGMWQDQTNARFFIDAHLRAAGVDSTLASDYHLIIDDYLAPVIEDLQQKYSDQVVINFSLLDSIRLSRIDMVATRPRDPFPRVVPDFPMVTKDNILDYGRQLDGAQKP